MFQLFKLGPPAIVKFMSLI